MKLRVRSLESRETLKIEVPNSCSLQHFNHLLSFRISSSSSSSSSSIYLSLNRKDELQALSPLDSLQSLGVTSGDLIFYTFNPAAFSRQNHPPPIAETLENQVTLDLSQTPVPKSGDEETLIQSQTPTMTEPVVEEAPILYETLVSNSERKETLVDSQTLGPSVQSDPPEEAQELPVLTGMDMDGGVANDDDGPVVVKKSFSEPCFLRKILREEVGDDGNEHKLLVIAVHAVMLESGFVGFDTVTGMGVDRFHFLEENPISMSLWYTLPELLYHGRDDSSSIQSVVLKVQPLGQFINIYGSLSSKRSSVCRVLLDKYRFAPTLDLVWTHSDSSEEKDRGSNDSYPENEVFEFWKIVKDGLVLPLLIDMCENAGLLPPPCLMRLPTELKLKILEQLPVTDLLNVGCVCSELGYLSRNNDLWKQRFVEEFGNKDLGQGSSLWKYKFAAWWKMRKKSKRMRGSIWKWFPDLDGHTYFPVRFGDPILPRGIGGDYDRIPGLGIPSPFGQPAHASPSPFGHPARRYPRHPMQRNTIPRCNLGGGFMG